MDEGPEEIARVARVDLFLEPSRSGRPGDTTSTAFGAFHNTDVWHPFFDYLSANDLADITAVVRIPSEYYLTTTVPQTDSVKGSVRTVYARSMHSAFLLALIYDRDWQPRVTDFGSFRFESFAGRPFAIRTTRSPPSRSASTTLLAPRFGEPQFPSRYLAAAQDRHLAAADSPSA